MVCAATERQIVDGVEEICLPHPVVPDETVHLGREGVLRQKYVFVVDDGYV